MSKQPDIDIGSSHNEGALSPELVYGDFSRLMRLYGALAFRVTRDLDLELLVKADPDEDSDGDYMWYDVTELDLPPQLRSVPN